MTTISARALLATDDSVGRWRLDSEASTVRLAHKTMWGMATVKGTFTQLSGEGTIEPGGAVSGRLVIDAASIDTKHKKRDTHLRSPEFFNVAEHPDITVQVNSATALGDDVQLKADLTVKGIREPLTLTGRVTEATTDSIKLTVHAQLDRARFGMSWNQVGMMRGLATVTVDATFTRTAS